MALCGAVPLSLVVDTLRQGSLGHRTLLRLRLCHRRRRSFGGRRRHRCGVAGEGAENFLGQCVSEFQTCAQYGGFHE